MKRAAPEDTRRYRVRTVGGGVLGCVIACIVPYTPLLNVLYGLNGYPGFVLMVFIVVHDVKMLARSRRSGAVK